MATFRNIQISFWTDTKVSEDFSVEERYFFLYLLTNPHTTLSGCYEISIKQMSDESGLAKDKCKRLIEKLERDYGVIAYSLDTREVLIVNWSKHNWTGSEKYRTALRKQISAIKNDSFKEYLQGKLDGIDTVSIPYQYPTDTTISITNTNTNTHSSSKKTKESKKQYGNYKHVLLTDSQYKRLCDDYGESLVSAGIKKVDEYCQKTGKEYKDYNLVLRDWGINDSKNGDRSSGRDSPYMEAIRNRVDIVDTWV